MTKAVVAPGTLIETLDGYYIVRGINEAGLCYCDEYTYDDDDRCVKSDVVARLTKQDIERELRALTGKVIKVVLWR